jgi:hypothetical protein
MVDGAKFDISKQNVLELSLMMSRLNDISPPCPICYPCMEDKCASQAFFCNRLNNGHNNEPKKE